MEHKITMDGLTVIVNLDKRTFRVEHSTASGRIEAGSPDLDTKNTNGNFAVPFRLVDWGKAVQECNHAKAALHNPVFAERNLRIQSAKQLILEKFPRTGVPPRKTGFLQSLTFPPHNVEQAIIEEALAELITEKGIFENEGHLFIE